MSEFQATHQSKGGIQVQAIPNRTCFEIYWETMTGVASALLAPQSFQALFEPIPRPKTVTIPLHAAHRILDVCIDEKLVGLEAAILQAAIAKTESEEAYHD